MNGGFDLLVYCDGGSRGNPGPSAIGFVVCSGEGEILCRHGECIGTGTNNQAEYMALIRALECALTHSRGKVHCFLDSELLVKQLNGEYRVRSSNLRQLFLRVKGLEKEFEAVKYTYLPRNTGLLSVADGLVNEALNQAK